jgi:branched-chain amino acid transport system permease protein
MGDPVRRPAAAHLSLRDSVITGTGTGLIAVYVVAVGIVPSVATRMIVAPWLSLATVVLIGIFFGAGMVVGRRSGASPLARIVSAVVVGLVAGMIYIGLMMLAQQLRLQATLVSLTPATLQIALFSRSSAEAWLMGLAITTAASLAGLGFAVAPPRLRATIRAATLALLAVALLRDIWVPLLRLVPGGRAINLWVYSGTGLSVSGALVIAAVAAALQFALNRLEPSPGRRLLGTVLLGALAALLPLVTSPFIAQVLLLVALYSLMGIGLNIELGLAGLLDLGFVAFFAIGAYVTALLTAGSPLAAADWGFWAALPMAVVAAAVGGFIFGLPVLRVRGDYLALATLGLGEIVRLLVGSDMLSSTIGGAQGIIGVPRPEVGTFSLTSQIQLYYLALVLTVLAGLVCHWLEHSAIGRAWKAAREDEDVAVTLGLDLVGSKLRAYVIGAAVAGISGALFATMLGSVFPQSFQLTVSINVLALLVVGGLGSLPGVFVGSLVLIGLPEFLREFGELRYLFYGFLLILVMRFRPEGLWPAQLQSTKA